MDAPNHRILIVDDDPEFRSLIKHLLHQSLPRADVVEYDPIVEGQPDSDFDWNHYDLLILDYDLNQQETGLDWLRTYKKHADFPATIMLTGAGNEEIAVRALKFGAQDYLRKEGLNATQLAGTIVEALESRAKEQSELNALASESTIFNKVQFYTHLEAAIHATDNDDLKALLLIELDDFDRLREAHGLITVDNIVRDMAKNVANAFAEDNPPLNITRFGDTTIALLLAAGASDDEVISAGERLSEQLSNNPYHEDDTTVDYTISIGATILHPGEHDSQRMFSQADKACRIARTKSDHAVHLYRAEDDEQAEDQGVQAETPETRADDSNETTRKDLRPQSDATTFDAEAAFKENRVVPYLQPVVAMSETTQQLDEEFYQVRLRMVQRNGDIVEPAEFLLAIEQRKLERMLDRWAIRECLGSLVQQERSKGRRLVFLLRLSRQTLCDDSFVDWLEQLIQRLGQQRPGTSIGFEMTPEDFLANREETVHLVGHLSKWHGIRFALMGVDTVSTLDACATNVKFDFVKLAPKLNASLGKANDRGRDAQQLVTRAREIGAFTVAERIEDAGTLAGVISAGIDFVQGYFIGTPQTEIGQASLVESLEIG